MPSPRITGFAARPRSAALVFTLGFAVAACHSPPEPAAHEPSVAARHASLSTVSSVAAHSGPSPASLTSSVAPSGSAAVSDDPALAFAPPARLRLPANLSASERVPLLLILHGFGVSSSLLIAKAGLDQLADLKRFAYLAPEGARDASGRPFWNAGPSCCDLEHQNPDDVKRLRELLAADASNVAIDAQRIFAIGYSNGAFMAQRLACDAGTNLAGVISVAGAAPRDVPCAQTAKLSFVEIHGDADPIVHYNGGTVFDRKDVQSHASARETAQFWGKQLGCAGPMHDAGSLDLEPNLPGSETLVQRFDDCHSTVELWTVQGGGHYVALQPPALEAMWKFIQDHPRSGG